jgi:glycosyltransferase involved in cell wall biosynthesis
VAEFGSEPLPARAGALADPQLVYVGSLDVQDGVLELVDLLATPELANAHLTVVGDGPLAPELRARAAAAELGDRIRLTGHVSHDDVPKLIAGCDIGIDPAPGTELNHGSTMIKVAEYLVSGRPLVAYSLRETQRTAGDAGVYAPCGDRREFARLVSALAADSDRRLDMGRRAHQRGMELTWEHSADVLRSVYAELR